MKYNSHNMPGPGDECTWGPITSSQDPRYDDSAEEAFNEAADEEYFVVLDDMDEVNASIGIEAFNGADWAIDYDNHLKLCADYIAECDWLALGKLIGEKAEEYMKEVANQHVIDRGL